MIRFTDTETDMIYQIDEIDGEIHLYYRWDKETPFQVVPMSPGAAAVLGKTLQRYAMPAVKPDEASFRVIPFQKRIA